MMISTLNAILLGAIGALLAIELGASNAAAVVIAILVFLLGWALHMWYAQRAIARGPSVWEPLFPSPRGDD
jgi:small-conductance mechanosensitive channel